ncbi:LIC_10091 family protein [Tautonia marina]
MISARGRESGLAAQPTTSFPELIRSLSEPETGPHADNLLTNEDSFPRVIGDLERRVTSGGLYLGVGPDQNFSYIARCAPARSFVLDFRRRNLRLHLLHKALFMLSETRVDYLTRLTARQPRDLPDQPTPSQLVEAFATAPFEERLLERTRLEVFGLIRALGVLDESEWDDLARIQARLAGPGMNAKFLAMPIYPTLGELIQTPDSDGCPAHLLAQESSYRTVRDAQRNDQVLPLVANLAGSVALPRLADWFQSQRLKVSVVYVSDVEFFLLRAGTLDAYVANLERLPRHENALIIRTSTRELDHPDRIPGDSSTTVLRSLPAFLDAARAGRITRPDDLFTPDA